MADRARVMGIERNRRRGNTRGGFVEATTWAGCIPHGAPPMACASADGLYPTQAIRRQPMMTHTRLDAAVSTARAPSQGAPHRTQTNAKKIATCGRSKPGLASFFLERRPENLLPVPGGHQHDATAIPYAW